MIRNHDLNSGRFKFGYKLSILLILNYFFGYQFFYPLGASLIYTPSNGSFHPRAQMFATILTLVVSLYLVRKPLARSFRFFLNHLSFNVKTIFQHVGLIYLVNLTMGILMQYILGDNVSGNQALVMEGFALFPVLYAFSAIIFAPLVEEILFRGVFYQELRNKKNYWLPVVISSLSFGLIHTLPIFFLTGQKSEILFLISYTMIGYLLTRVYEKTGSIWSSVFVHFLNNFIATLLLLGTLGGS